MLASDGAEAVVSIAGRLSSFVCNENVANLKSTHALQTETPLMYSCTLYCALSRLARAQVFPRLRSSPFPFLHFVFSSAKNRRSPPGGEKEGGGSAN